MYSSIPLLALLAQSIYGAPFLVLDRTIPASEELKSSTETPVSSGYDWATGYVSEFPIHSSCNSTERNQITQGLEDAVVLARHAKEHILVHGNKSEIFQKYFGKGSVGAVIGWFDKIASSNRAGIIFRCDDPDQNCATQNNWAGHHRGSNASSETVICPLSYTTRLPLSSICSRGFTIATGKPAVYWGADLIHRLYHVDLVGEEIVTHHADGYAGVTALASGANYTLAATNSASLSYFATEVYAFDISVPGEGCVGKHVAGAVDDHATPVVSSSSGVAPTRVVSAPAVAATTSAATSGQECHSHDDGTLHCV